ncbi:hypothetical protein HL670_03772 [Serratia plymuthica]|nr:hypothetical protein HL670_03772 [Serratia plymuthica]
MGNHQDYLLPVSFSQCFKNYASFSRRGADSRQKLQNRLVDLRKYRYRLMAAPGNLKMCVELKRVY